MNDMYRLVSAGLLLCALFCLTVRPTAQAGEYHGFFLGGQSNMQGLGSNRELPPNLNRTFPSIRIFHGPPRNDGPKPEAAGIWSALRPGHGGGFDADDRNNHYGLRFGPELSFGVQLEQQLDVPIALIKYAKGGTAIQAGAAPGGSWDPNINGFNQFDHLQAAARRALSIKDIDGDGHEDQITIAGIAWFQGEGDAAHTKATAERYADRLVNLVKRIRLTFQAPSAPVVIVRITDSGQDADGQVMQFGDVVRSAQERFVRIDGKAALVKTDAYEFRNDRWHFTSASYIKIGIAMAEAFVKLGK